MRKHWKQWQILFLGGSKITADGDWSLETKRKKAMTNLDSILKNRDITFPTKVCLLKAMVFPVVTYGCESWTIKKAELQRIDAFELWCWRRLESLSDCKIQPVHPKGNQSWIFIGRTDVEAETWILWPPDGKKWLIGKDPDTGKDWMWEEKGMTEDELVELPRPAQQAWFLKVWYSEIMRNETQEFREKQGSGDQGEGAEIKPNQLYYTFSCEWKNMQGVKL